jgi:hypothetical protein
MQSHSISDVTYAYVVCSGEVLDKDSIGSLTQVHVRTCHGFVLLSLEYTAKESNNGLPYLDSPG